MIPLFRPWFVVVVLAAALRVAGVASALPADEPIIDTQGIVYGLPFGSGEDALIDKFGKPDGYLRLDDHRTALIYGRAYLLLCYDGSFDGVLIDRSAINGQISRWMKDAPPFIENGWRLSNGVTPEMTLKAVKEIVKADPGSRKYQLTFSTEQCTIHLTFSHYTDRGEGDDTYNLDGLLMARKNDGKDYWSEAAPNRFAPGRTFAEPNKGRKMIGAILSESDKGVRVRGVLKETPADKAGIVAGDLITSLNGESLVGILAAAFTRRMAAHDANDLEITNAHGDKRVVRVEGVDAATFTDQLAGQMLAVTEVREGDASPDFEAKSADGKPVKLSDLKGSPVLVEFTAEGAPVCDEATRRLVTAYAKYKDRGLKIISVSLNDASVDVFAHARELGADWPINWDGKGWENAVARTYGVSGIPANVLVGKDGTILSTDADKERLEPAIDAALK